MTRTYIGKRKVCCTDIADFTDYQGMGHDPLYKRYDSVEGVVKRSVPKEYWHFLAIPSTDSYSGQIAWLIDDWTQQPVKLTELQGNERVKYDEIKQKTLAAYNEAINQAEGEDLTILMAALKYKDDERIYCSDGKVFLIAWGMTMDTNKHQVIGAVIHEVVFTKKFDVTFDAGQHGALSSKLDQKLTCPEGTTLTEKNIPRIDAHEGWSLSRWTPEIVGYVVKKDITFYAQYVKQEPKVPDLTKASEPVKTPEPVMAICRFDAGEHGVLDGEPTRKIPIGSRLTKADIPGVKAKKGYSFKGWNISPLNFLVSGNATFTAQYTKDLPWWRRWRLVPTGRGCLKWLLRIIGLLILLWLLILLLRSCIGCGVYHPVNGVVPIDSVSTVDGRKVEDNGFTRPVTGKGGRLPEDDRIVAPVLGEGGTDVPIITQPGVPDVIADRLLLFMEESNGDIEALAKDFKAVYPDKKYAIVGYDKEVKLLVVQVPESERDRIRQTINDKIPNHRFFVFDEEIYELHGHSTLPIPFIPVGTWAR